MHRRALLKKPKILILDDSTSAVDTKTDKLIRSAFHNEIPDTTKIIIAQRVASVQESDMILVMDSGRIMRPAHTTNCSPPAMNTVPSTNPRPRTRPSPKNWPLPNRLLSHLPLSRPKP